MTPALVQSAKHGYRWLAVVCAACPRVVCGTPQDAGLMCPALVWWWQAGHGQLSTCQLYLVQPTPTLCAYWSLSLMLQVKKTTILQYNRRQLINVILHFTNLNYHQHTVRLFTVKFFAYSDVRTVHQSVDFHPEA